MSNINEFREFFLRNIKVLLGSNKDQESNYPVQYTVTIDGKNITVNNRFLKGNYPSEDVMSKFLSSITFKLNTEDTATNLVQGLAKVASSTMVLNGTNVTAVYQSFVQPSDVFYLHPCNALPTVATNIKLGDMFLVLLKSDVAFGNLYVCNQITPALSFTLAGTTHPIPTGGSAGQIVAKNSNTQFDLIWNTPVLPLGTNILLANLIQNGTAAPTVTDIFNSYGTIVPARTSTGVYTLTKTGAFISGKTFVTFTHNFAQTNIINTADVTSADVITITTIINPGTGDTHSDSILSGYLLIITLP